MTSEVSARSVATHKDVCHALHDHGETYHTEVYICEQNQWHHQDLLHLHKADGRSDLRSSSWFITVCSLLTEAACSEVT